MVERTRTVVGMDEVAPHDDDAAMLASLRARAAEIEQRLADIERDAKTAAGGIGFGKRIGEGTNIAVERISEVSMHAGLQAELANIRRAEEKLTEGDAGRCDSCGEPIPADRLEAIPWAVRCVSCAV